ncbi:NAD(P)H-dependent oxidoreductase [Leptospira sp. GIMC2001]|uniref:NAD(P)H-dependent oxidoreductase n=1 Tax=Leptospira sp. GIMC2001 TaxID=1513297 RepID=UPI002349A9C3|nr:NAD(P)H-dependent oxidoreductase [Leptospira sp. GIMC2001]WCL48918.1 NAD(P)H-dependent oxidoreductase [Leptospira sp. GIMC2001]
MNYLDQLKWRYATKKMNGAKVPKEKIDNILEAIQLSASSLGFQPYSIYVIESDSMKNKIFESGACTQSQVKAGSHLIVFAAWSESNPKQVDNFFNLIASTRSVSLESLAGFRKSVESAVLSKSPDQMLEWSARQAYIALGFALNACAIESIDATPMEGFDPAKMDEVLGLTARKEKSVVMMALGYRDAENDPLSKAKKVRRPKSELFQIL